MVERGDHGSHIGKSRNGRFAALFQKVNEVTVAIGSHDKVVSRVVQ